MSVNFECDCGKKYRVKDDMIGKKIRCKECGEAIIISDQEDVSEYEEPKSEPKSAKHQYDSSKNIEKLSGIESPITKIVDRILDMFRIFDKSPGKFQKMQKSAAKSGVYTVLLMSALSFVNFVLMAIKMEVFFFFLIGIAIVIAGGLLHYVAARFAYAGQHLIDSTPYKISSKNLPDCLGLIALSSGVGAFFFFGYTAIKASDGTLFLIGVAALLAGSVVASLFLNVSSCLNIHVTDKSVSAGETGLGFLVLFFRAILAISPDVLFGGAVLTVLANLYAGYLIMSDKFEGVAIATTGAYSTVAIALSPVYLYVVYIVYILIADVIKSIFDIAHDIGKIAENKDSQ